MPPSSPSSLDGTRRPYSEQDFALYEKLLKQGASKHMANMCVSEVSSWLTMALEARDGQVKDYCVRSAWACCDKYLEEMRKNQNY